MTWARPIFDYRDNFPSKRCIKACYLGTLRKRDYNGNAFGTTSQIGEDHGFSYIGRKGDDYSDTAVFDADS